MRLNRGWVQAAQIVRTDTDDGRARGTMHGGCRGFSRALIVGLGVADIDRHARDTVRVDDDAVMWRQGAHHTHAMLDGCNGTVISIRILP